jgi:hypothetical protein
MSTPAPLPACSTPFGECLEQEHLSGVGPKKEMIRSRGKKVKSAPGKFICAEVNDKEEARRRTPRRSARRRRWM